MMYTNCISQQPRFFKCQSFVLVPAALITFGFKDFQSNGLPNFAEIHITHYELLKVIVYLWGPSHEAYYNC